MKICQVLWLLVSSYFFITSVAVCAFDKETDCRLPPDAGPCMNRYFREFYHDPSSGRCFSMVYGGCGGNANRFRTERECLDACSGINSQGTLNIDPTCLPPDDPGCYSVAQSSVSLLYYLDVANGICRPSYYCRADGNSNGFSTQFECISRCLPRSLAQEEFMTTTAPSSEEDRDLVIYNFVKVNYQQCFGESISTFQNVSSARLCADKCNSIPGCSAFIYNTVNKRCTPKFFCTPSGLVFGDQVQPGDQLWQRSITTAGVTSQRPTTIQQTTQRPYPLRNYKQIGYHCGYNCKRYAYTVSSLSGCATVCEWEQPSCSGFSYRPYDDGGQCELKANCNNGQRGAELLHSREESWQRIV